MKTRKTLEISFREPFDATIFLWDGYSRGFAHTEGASRNVLLITVQRRSERAEIARVARDLYGASTRTLVR